MRLPIIIDEFGNVQVFATLERAQAAYEAPDIVDSGLIAYDADGFLLQMIALGPHDVAIRDTEMRENRAAELYEKLIVYIARLTRLPKEWFVRAGLSLEELVVHMTPLPEPPKKPFLQRLFPRLSKRPSPNLEN